MPCDLIEGIHPSFAIGTWRLLPISHKPISHKTDTTMRMYKDAQLQVSTRCLCWSHTHTHAYIYTHVRLGESPPCHHGCSSRRPAGAREFSVAQKAAPKSKVPSNDWEKKKKRILREKEKGCQFFSLHATNSSWRPPHVQNQRKSGMMQPCCPS